jgi:hypothetical protein
VGGSESKRVGWQKGPGCVGVQQEKDEPAASSHACSKTVVKWGGKPGREWRTQEQDWVRADRRQGFMSFGCRDVAEAALGWRVRWLGKNRPAMSSGSWSS